MYVIRSLTSKTNWKLKTKLVEKYMDKIVVNRSFVLINIVHISMFDFKMLNITRNLKNINLTNTLFHPFILSWLVDGNCYEPLSTLFDSLLYVPLDFNKIIAKSNVLPGQRTSLQSRASYDGPTQSSPLPNGAGSLQLRTRICFPIPHVMLQWLRFPK